MKITLLPALLLLLVSQANCVVDGVVLERVTDVKTLCSGNRIEFLFDEAQDVRKITLRFPAGEKLPRPSSVRVLYWYNQVSNGEWGGEWRYAKAVGTASSIHAKASANKDSHHVMTNDRKSTGGALPVSSTPISQSRTSPTTPTENAPTEKRPGPFSFVPTDHWAYEAIRNLMKRRIVVGYPEGTIGSKAVLTRFEFAQAVARVAPMLRDAVQRKSSSDAPKLEKADLEILTRLMAEFQEELIAIGVDADAMKRDMADLSRRLTPRTTDITGRPILVIAPFELSEPEIVWTFTFSGGTKPSNSDGVHNGCQESRKLRMIFPCAVPKISGVEVVAAK